jgi:hypothetical protein
MVVSALDNCYLYEAEIEIMKKLIFIALASFLFSACSSPSKNAAKTEKSVVNEDGGPVTIGQMVKANAKRVDFAENELSNMVSEFVAANPSADYDDVASFANKKLKEVGIAFDLIALDADPQGTETLIKTIDGQRLNVGMFWEPLCAEGIAARYPVVSFKKNVWTVKYKSGTYEIRAKPVRTGEVIRIKDEKKITEIPIPEEGFEPGGISKNGKALFGRMSLNPATNVWWRQQMRRDPKEEPPFLVLLLSNDKIEFSENEEDLDNFEESPQRKTSEDDTYQINYPDSPYKFKSTVCT